MLVEDPVFSGDARYWMLVKLPVFAGQFRKALMVKSKHIQDQPMLAMVFVETA